MTDLTLLLRLLLATTCGVAIGAERQYRSRTAGLRTNALVTTGAAIFVLVGVQADVPTATIQITAYVVSGVGFLGGGVILRQGFSIQGLNTAATLWCSAAIGAQAATGHTLIAIAATILVLGVHVILRPLGHILDKDPGAKDEDIVQYLIHVTAAHRQEARIRAHVLHVLAQGPAAVRGLNSTLVPPTDTNPHPDSVELTFDVLIEGDARTLLDPLVAGLFLDHAVHAVSWNCESTTDPDLTTP
ncbi:Protein MgtC [Austwickia sp. TVS 96-490-7B]|uniref:MgtC/SapB family protein n=1 Tax=Austwickia sp. TVS 96-490-7B TaxID=2830843 RepID=UPI001C57B347|nr:MgtC/SapB family protein [Austwickia sp. TVS 96-490-7B]MBW3084322.1 Protein MgtC [Austwickia sp. TVS 96-490-7B]